VKSRQITMLIVMAWMSTPLMAQTPGAVAQIDIANGLSLDAAIARAIDQEPSLRAARSTVDIATAMRMQAGLRPNPSLLFEQRTEPGGTDAQTTIGLQWPLDLFRRDARIAVAEREVATAELSIADRRRLLAAEVRLHYGNVIASLRELSVLDELLGAARRQLELLTARVNEGAAPPLERDVLIVEVQRLESQRSTLLGGSDSAMVDLKRTVGLSPDVPLTLRDALEWIVERESVTPPAGSAGADERSDVREAAARVSVAEAKIERAHAQGRVDIGVFANYMRMDAAFPQQGFAPGGGLERIRGVFHYFSAGASMTLPLLSRNQGEIAAAEAERVGAIAAHEAARLSAQSEVASARAVDQRARDAIRSLSGARTLARQNLSVLGQSYELGRVSVFDVLNERRRYLELESAYSDALRAAFDARTALIRALGEQP
jgi:outer membrane protein, heavy metal efflux system